MAPLKMLAWKLAPGNHVVAFLPEVLSPIYLRFLFKCKVLCNQPPWKEEGRREKAGCADVAQNSLCPRL